MLSLYENNVNVIVRHKASAEVEYGNKVSLMEQRDGLIVDWDLARGEAPADTKLCIESSVPFQKIEVAAAAKTANI